MKRSKLLQCLYCLMAMLGTVADSVHAQSSLAIPGFPDKIEVYDPREIALLPKYCHHTQSFRDTVPGGNNPAEIQKWTKMFSHRTFDAMHHYCWGLMKTNRALVLAQNKRTRMYYLDASIGEFNYVLNNANQSFVLLPEVLTKKGDNLIRLGRFVEGQVELQRAISVKPDYWPPYTYMSDYFKEAGDKAKAREWLDKGLAATPDAKALQQRLAELGGSAAGSRKTPPPSAAVKPPPSAQVAPAEKPEPGADPEPAK